MGRFLFTLAQMVWGFPQTLAGFIVLLAHRGQEHFVHHGAVVTYWRDGRGLSLGLFVFLPADADDRLLVHEYGHAVQSLVLGPLYLAIVGLPSLVWANAPSLAKRRRERRQSYYAFYTERHANALGELVLKRPSMGLALVD